MNLLNYFDNIYYINLDEDINKKEYFTEEIKKSVLHKKYSKYSAVIGKYLDIRLVPNSIITEDAKQDIILKKQRSYGISLTYGSLACALSHYYIYMEAKDRIKPYLIFEDDIILDNNFDNDLYNVLEEIKNKNFDIVYLGYNEIPGFSKVDISDVLSKPQGLITGLYGYIVSPQGAAKLIKGVFPLNKQIDSSISDNIGLLEAYCSKKNIVGVKTNFGSKTQNQPSCKNENNYVIPFKKQADSWDKLFR